VGGNVKWCSYWGKQYEGRFLKNYKIELTYNPEIPLLRMYPKNCKWDIKVIFANMFTVALCIVAKRWQTECLWTDK
jgi:hypothetical protein